MIDKLGKRLQAEWNIPFQKVNKKIWRKKSLNQGGNFQTIEPYYYFGPIEIHECFFDEWLDLMQPRINSWELSNKLNNNININDKLYEAFKEINEIKILIRDAKLRILLSVA
jgi:hypothetical protein